MLVSLILYAIKRSAHNYTLPVKRPGNLIDFEGYPLIVPESQQLVAWGCAAKEPSVLIDVVDWTDVHLVVEGKTESSDVISAE
jgi:hypothetical protein